jgi:hypothetical protein
MRACIVGICLRLMGYKHTITMLNMNTFNHLSYVRNIHETYQE